jgi:hypothetical protein
LTGGEEHLDKPEIGDSNRAFGDVNHLEGVTRATVLVMQVLDKRRNDVATKITRLIRQANVPHRHKARQETYGPSAQQVIFQGAA